jgi:hypothetical protein
LGFFILRLRQLFVSSGVRRGLVPLALLAGTAQLSLAAVSVLATNDPGVPALKDGHASRSP